MQYHEQLCRYYREHNIRVSDSFHPLTEAAKYVKGIFCEVPNSKLKSSAHAVVTYRQESGQIFNLLNMNMNTKATFGFPGGGIELIKLTDSLEEVRESPEECVRREIFEELGFAPFQYQLLAIGYLAAVGCHFPLYLVDITGQTPSADRITGSTHISLTLLEDLYQKLPGNAGRQVKSVLSRYLK